MEEDNDMAEDFPNDEDFGMEEDEEEIFYEEDPEATNETSYIKTRVHQKDAVSVAISPSGQYIATGGCDDRALLFKPSHNLKLPFMVYNASDTVQELTFDNQEKFLIYSSGEDVNLIDLNYFVYPKILSLGSTVSSIAWNPSTQGLYNAADFFLAVLPEMKYVTRIQVDRTGLIQNDGFYYAGEEPTGITVIPKSQCCIISFNNGLILMFDIEKHTQIGSINTRTPITALELIWGNSFVVGFNSGSVSVISFTPDGKLKNSARLGEDKDEEKETPVEAICVSKNSSRPYIAFATVGGNIEIHDLNTAKGLRFKYNVGNISILKLAFDERVDKLYAGTYDGTFYIFDVHSDKVLDIYVSRGKINTFDFAMCRINSGKMLACSVSSKGELRYFLDPFPEKELASPAEIYTV